MGERHDAAGRERHADDSNALRLLGCAAAAGSEQGSRC